MSKEQLPEDKVFIVKLIQLIFSYRELTLVRSLEDVFGGTDFKNCLTSTWWFSTANLEPNGLQTFFYVGAAVCFSFTEVGITRAVKIRHCFLPLSLQTFEERWRHSNQCGSSINDSRIAARLANLGWSIEQGFARQRPGFDVRKNVWIVPERLETGCSSNNLLLVNATKHGKTILITKT